MRVVRIILCVMIAVCVANSVMAQSRDVAVECAWGKIGATIDMSADGGKTAVLVIAGSGPTDRYGNSGMGLNTYCYKMLGEALAEAQTIYQATIQFMIANLTKNVPVEKIAKLCDDLANESAALKAKISK